MSVISVCFINTARWDTPRKQGLVIHLSLVCFIFTRLQQMCIPCYEVRCPERKEGPGRVYQRALGTKLGAY